MFDVSKLCESEILKVSRKLLYLAQNFDEEFFGLEQLKKTHFGIITKLLWYNNYILIIFKIKNKRFILLLNWIL